MQTKDFDLATALDLLENYKNFFKDLRLDKSFNETIVDARELADEIDVEANFELTTTTLRKKKKGKLLI